MTGRVGRPRAPELFFGWSRLPAVTLLVLSAFAPTAAGCAKIAAAPAPERTLDRPQAKAIVADFLGAPRRLRVLALTKFPSGPGYELKADDGPGYFVVDVARREVSYAMFDTLFAKTSANKLNFDRSVSAAKKWASKRALFKDFRLLKTETGYDWPKRGYATVIWRGAQPNRSARDFAKVTIDLTTGGVAAFGVGNPKWTMFCLPPGIADNFK